MVYLKAKHLDSSRAVDWVEKMAARLEYMLVVQMVDQLDYQTAEGTVVNLVIQWAV